MPEIGLFVAFPCMRPSAWATYRLRQHPEKELNVKNLLHCIRRRILLVIAALAMTSAATANPQVIRVSNVDELYSAVNDPASAGRTLMLAPGTYLLSVNDPNGAPRPNGGRLELQRDMTLRGRSGDLSAVIIDAYNLPASSFPQTANGVATGPNAPVRLGLGRNTLEWLTVRDGRFAQANIDTGLQPLDLGNAYIRIAHVASSGSVRGLNVLNFGPQASGQIIEADIINCDFHDNSLGLSEGVRLGNFQGARGSIVNVRMVGNTSRGQKQGRLIVNNRAIESTVNVLSIGNRFFENGAGTIIVGGLSSNNTRADYNTINFNSYSDQFTNNTGTTEFDHGGLVALGTEDISAAGGGSFNTVNVKLWQARLQGNNTSDLTGIGARALSDATAANNQGNRVTVEIHGDGRGKDQPQRVETFADSIPATPNYDNSVSVAHCRSPFGNAHHTPDHMEGSRHGYGHIGVCSR
jgi:hypothetical protein